MSERSGDLHLGFVCQGDSVQVALVDASGTLLEANVLQRTPSFAEDLDLALRAAPRDLRAIMIATDSLRDALDSAPRLARVAALRIGGPVSTGVPVLASWPQQLIDRISPITQIVDGVVNESGTELVPFDEAAAKHFFELCVGQVDAVAISSVFAPLATEYERRAAAIAARVFGDRMPITMSHSVAGFGLLDRENSAILSAALTPLATEILREVDSALARYGIEAEVFLGQNDGTLAVLDSAVAAPIRLLEGAAAAGIYGAGQLAGVKDAVVTSDGLARAGVLRDGFVVMTSAPTWVAGTRMNVELPVGTGASAPSHPLASSTGTRVSIATGSPGANSLPNAEVAAAFGLALAPVGATAWVVSERDDSERFRLLQAEQQVIEMAIIAGADPATVAVSDIDSIGISHSSKRQVRIRATGRPMFVSRADRSVIDPPVSYPLTH